MKVLVLGGAVSGRAAARLLRHLGHEAVIFDTRPAPLAELRAAGFEVHSGAWSRRRLRDADLVVTSPGFPEHAPEIADATAAGLPVWSEIEFAARQLDVPLVAVTGTNGKTTVTTLIAGMLQRSGLQAPAAGNIGLALADVALQVLRGEVIPDVVVVEASSFQLRFVDQFRAGVAVVLNVAPDHLDWHGDYERYLAAKANVLRNQQHDDLLVYDADDPGATRIAAAAPGRTLPVSGRRRPDRGSGPEGGKLFVDDVAVDMGPVAGLGAAYLMDLAAAGAAALASGATAEAVAAAVRDFNTGAHRRSLVGSWEGVDWVDDSKATNPHAALASVAAYDSVVLVAGGRNKGLDLVGLATAPGVRQIVAIGEAGPDLVAAAPGRAVLASGMEEAIELAAAAARPGDTVLLAPGCASFDMFDSYSARGDAFAAAVRAHHGGHRE